MEDLVGQKLLGRYQVEAFVGRGGMAEVYEAMDERRRIRVALKFLRDDLAEDEVFLRRFRREAKVLEALQHPNIVRYYGFEETDDLHFLVVEFIHGEGLRKKLSRMARPLTLEETLYILEPVCNALHYAHAEGIYHCDVKPANIMLDRGARVVVADFGISRLAESATLTYGATGTPAYMAPEQCRGQKVEARTDLYALAITAFEMLTLDRPFRGETAPIEGTISEKIRWEQMKAEPPSVRRYNPEVPEWADRAILKAMRKRRSGRFKSVLAFYDALSDNGKAAPSAALPWSEEDAEAAAASTLDEAPALGATWGSRVEQMVTDAWWAVRRRVQRARRELSRSRERLPSVGSAWAWLPETGTKVASAARERPAVRRMLYGAAGLLLLAAAALAVYSLAGKPNAPLVAAPTATATAVSRASATANPSATPAGRRLTVQNDIANIRSGPSTLYPIIGVAEKGDVFDIVGRAPSELWYWVCCVDGKRGWVHAELVSLSGNADSVPVLTPTPPPPQQIGLAAR